MCFSETLSFINAGIPVMAHLGLTPQSINQLGGWKVQGKNELAIQALLQDAQELEKAGVFSIVLEGLPPNVAKNITFSEYAAPFFLWDSCPHIRRLLDERKSITHRHAKNQRYWIERYILPDKLSENKLRQEQD